MILEYKLSPMQILYKNVFFYNSNPNLAHQL